LSGSQDGRLVWPPTKEDLERLYLNQKLSAAKIANAFGLKYKSAKVAESTILYQLKKNGIKRRDKADHVRRFTEAIVDEWVGRYKAGESLKQIAGNEISPVSVFLHLRKRGVKLRDKVEAQIQAVTKYERRPFDGSKEDEAYLVGFSKGDCHVLKHGRAIRVRTSTTHVAMADLFDDLFGQYGMVKRYARNSPLTNYEWNLEVDLDGTFEFLLKPIFDSLEEYGKIPANFISFLAGFADAEGTIYFHVKGKGGGFEFYFSNTDVKLLTLIQDFLSMLGHFSRISIINQGLFRLGYEKTGKVARLILWRKDNLVKLLQLLPLRHSEKKSKADLALKFMRTENKKVRTETLERWEDLLLSIDKSRKTFILEAEQQFSAKQKSGDREV
jgi:hypothetical protein